MADDTSEGPAGRDPATDTPATDTPATDTPATDTPATDTADSSGVDQFVDLSLESSPSAAIEAVAPVMGFLIVNMIFDRLAWAIVAATVLSVLSIGARWRRGSPIGKLLPLLAIAVVGRGLIGLYYQDSANVYFGLGIAAKFGFAAVLFGSVLIGRNLAARLMPHAFGFGERVTEHPDYVRATARITAAAAGYYLLSSLFDVWLLRNASTNAYVMVRLVVNWVVSSALMLGCLSYLAQQLKSINGFPGLMAMFEERVERQAAAFGWDLSE